MSRTLLEDFVRDYVETIGGAFDEVEPQVYDLLLPPAGLSRLDTDGSHVLRVAFDPEAIPEHPGAQLASYGTPLIDRLLEDAMRRGRYCRVCFLGLNLNPHDLTSRVRRGLSLAAGVEVAVERSRAMQFPQALFWFQADFVSDQKEQEVIFAAVDLHHGRLMRHQEKLLDQSRLADWPAQPLPEAPHACLSEGFRLAQEEVLRTLATFAHARERDLRERLDRQAGRMQRYYTDLRSELETTGARSKDRVEAEARRASRTQAVDREESLRLTELRQKNSLRVQLRLLQTLVIQQPKVLVHAALTTAKHASVQFGIVWDPLLESLEAVACPLCGKPSLALGLPAKGGGFCCARCLEKGPAASPR